MSRDGAGTARRRRTSVTRRFVRQLGLLVPGLDDVRRHRPVVAPLVLVAVFSLASAYALRPMVVGALESDVAGAVEAWLWISALLSPVSAGGKALGYAAVAWSLLVVARRDAAFRRLLSVFLYGESLLASHAVALALVLQIRGPGSVSGPEDLYVAMGMDALVQPTSPAWAALARGIGVVHAVWFVFLVVALVRVVDLPRRWALVLAGGAWALVLALSAVRALSVGTL